MSTRPVRTRMAPSPTGEYHVGHIATLLKNYAFARKHGGQFVLRIEDTDQVRKVEGAVEKILKVITDYGLDWDEGPQKGGAFGPYVQSERLALYKRHALQLVEQGKAYYCFCSKERLDEVRERQRASKLPPGYDGHCRSLSATEVEEKSKQGVTQVIRLKVPQNQEVSFTDLIRGDITFNSSEIDDQVLMKSDGFPTYHLAVVVDDNLMQISHVMRGEEWISSTPKHVLLYQAFGWQQPVYAHIPIFLNPDGKGKMSKRKGTVSAQSFLDQGYLPAAMLNFFMILGWAHPDEKELLDLDEYCTYFDPKDISAKSVVFDLKKLAWINGQYIRQLSLPELISKLMPYIPEDFPADKVKIITSLVHERLEKLSDFEGLTSFFYRPIQLDQTAMLKKADRALVVKQLVGTMEVLAGLTSWTVDAVEKAIRDAQEKHDWHRAQYFMMLRLAVTGSKATPPLFDTIAAFSQKDAIERLSAAHNLLKT